MNIIISILSSREVIVVGLTVLVAIAFAVAAYIGSAIMKNTRLAKYAKAWELARAKALDMIITIRTEGVDLTNVNGINYVELSKGSIEKYGRFVDPRMLYTLDEVDAFIKKTANIELDAIDIILAGESLYQRVRRAANGLVMNDKDVAQTTALPADTKTDVATVTVSVETIHTQPTELEGAISPEAAAG